MQLQKGRGCQMADTADVENVPKLKQLFNQKIQINLYSKKEGKINPGRESS